MSGAVRKLVAVADEIARPGFASLLIRDFVDQADEGQGGCSVLLGLLVEARRHDVGASFAALREGGRALPVADLAQQLSQVRARRGHRDLRDSVICDLNALVSSHGQSVSHCQSFHSYQSLKYCGRCEPAPPDAAASACPSSVKEAPMAVSKRLRYEILRRDNHACRYCGATAPDTKLNVDHVIPQSLGGHDKPDNLVTSCVDCNAGKTSSMPNAMPVADVDQDTFREAAEAKKGEEARELSDRLWRGGYPPQWGRLEIERHAADAAWTYAWSVASKGGDPSHEQYTEFLVHSAALFEIGHSVGEVLCAAVHAGSQLTPDLSWGLAVTDMQYVAISGEQYTRIDGVYERWLEVWKERRDAEPTPQQVGEFRGRLIVGVREGYSRDQLMRAARSAAFAGTTDVDYFAYHVACEDGDKVGDL